MFSFFEEIFSLTGLPLEVLRDGFKVTNFANKAVFVEHQTSIISISEAEIKCKLPRGICVVRGQNLKIKNMTESTVLIVGQIEQLSTE